jgi:hypothetical protein
MVGVDDDMMMTMLLIRRVMFGGCGYRDDEVPDASSTVL